MTRTIGIVGGGIAGLSAAWHLARRAECRVMLFERERLLCSHASGSNAAIFRPLEEDALLVGLAVRSRQLFDELSPNEPLVDNRGLVLLHSQQQALEATAKIAAEHDVPCQLMDARSLRERVGTPGHACSAFGLFTPLGGVIDIHALALRLQKACRDLGVSIRPDVSVEEVVVERGRIHGVRTRQGLVEADDVVLAAGAWQLPLAVSVGCGLELSPVRRHLALIKPRKPVTPSLPAVWKLDDEVYFRREGQNLLASPCDETAWGSGTVQADVSALAPLSEKLARVEPELGLASVVRFWACLRTFASDRRPVIGADPRLPGLFWMGGFGGFGMSTSLAAGELLAASMVEGRQLGCVSPQRVCAPADLLPGDVTSAR